METFFFFFASGKPTSDLHCGAQQGVILSNNPFLHFAWIILVCIHMWTIEIFLAAAPNQVLPEPLSVGHSWLEGQLTTWVVGLPT